MPKSGRKGLIAFYSRTRHDRKLKEATSRRNSPWNSRKMPSKCGALSSFSIIIVLLSISSTTNNSKISWTVVNVTFIFSEEKGSHQYVTCKATKHILRTGIQHEPMSRRCVYQHEPEISNASLNTSAVKGHHGECMLYDNGAVLRSTIKTCTYTLR